MVENQVDVFFLKKHLGVSNKSSLEVIGRSIQSIIFAKENVKEFHTRRFSETGKLTTLMCPPLLLYHQYKTSLNNEQEYSLTE